MRLFVRPSEKRVRLLRISVAPIFSSAIVLAIGLQNAAAQTTLPASAQTTHHSGVRSQVSGTVSSIFPATNVIVAAGTVEPGPTEVPRTIRTYSVLDVGKPGVPLLTRLQKAWLALIKRAPGYRKIWKTLRFLPMNDDKLPLTALDPGPSWKDGGAWQGFHIIGDDCNAYIILDPRDGPRIQPFTECGPQDMRPAVPGEKALLGWDPAE